VNELDSALQCDGVDRRFLRMISEGQSTNRFHSMKASAPAITVQRTSPSRRFVVQFVGDDVPILRVLSKGQTWEVRQATAGAVVQMGSDLRVAGRRNAVIRQGLGITQDQR
jgi:hypothetical protein